MPDGYDTDAEYLLAAARALGEAASAVRAPTNAFDTTSGITAQQWGSYAQGELTESYDYTRATMLACLARVENVLAAHAKALHAAGEEYLRREQQAKEALDRTRR